MVMTRRDVIRTVRDMLAPLRGKVKGIVRRATLGGVDTLGQLVTAQVNTTAGDVDDDVEIFEQYGFASVPPPGCEGIALRVGAERGHTIGALFNDRAFRVEGLASGEVAVYHPAGQSIVMRNDGSIEVFPAPGQTVHLGGPAGLAVARATDPVTPSTAMSTWASNVEAALAAAGSPIAVSFGVAAQNSFATIQTGGEGATST